MTFWKPIVFVALMVVGCVAADPFARPVAFCNSYASILIGLSEFKKRMTISEIMTVNRAIDIIEPACMQIGWDYQNGLPAPTIDPTTHIGLLRALEDILIMQRQKDARA